MCQLIIGGYNGSTNSIFNLFNVYGWWEQNGGFGTSLVNEGGMPWAKISAALANIANTPAFGAFGGPITYRGFSYSLDLSGLPNPPSFYRIGGVNASLMEIISQICEDGACDYYVELRGFTIRVRTVSRFNQPPLGTINFMINSLKSQGVEVESQVGLESRNEITSSFLVGGDVTSLFLADSTAIAPFWGLDANGLPILGSGDGDAHTMLLNAAPVADILGASVYQCSVLEMRFALASQELWAWYVSNNRPDIRARVGIVGPLGNMDPLRRLLHKPQAVNDNPNNVVPMAQNAIAGALFIHQSRLYEFIRQYASEYMGKKFLVSVPFVLRALNPTR
jgi:hypothetical protein